MSVAPTAVIVLAAGQGTRMKSSRPKVLHAIGGRSLLGHVLAAAAPLRARETVVVIGAGRDQVAEHLQQIAPSARTAVQEEQLGSGHAARMGLEVLDRVDGTVLVLNGDAPLLTEQTLIDFADHHAAHANAMTILSAEVPDPKGLGRIVRDGEAVTAIVEQKDATPEQAAITEINAGVYAFEGQALREVLGNLSRENAQGEEYLTEAVTLLLDRGGKVGAFVAATYEETLGCNDRLELADRGRMLNDRLCQKWMREGVTIVDPATTWIDADVELAPDVTLLPGTHLVGATKIESGATVGPECTIIDCEVGPDATIVRTHAELAVIGKGASVGPFAYLRPNSRLGEGGKIGTFVETKNADIGASSKVPHLTYVGDATIGIDSNIGASSVFVNYDGVTKSRTVIGDHCRLGSDNMLVAPVTVGDGAYSGAGTVVRKDVPPGALAISGGVQRNLLGWVVKNRPGTASAQAAEAAEQSQRNTNADRDAMGNDA
ncbi:bifunctional UDP-N-acetylglucosamine diphosphorylase/glucosamine-1-phosphate N-acetyltransferase GlmU [Blastococcus sp. Marseille-P5729]|uniref:bifunctional UDP-N-acetylglucosamine diphosphorylase/glucosamine-1-phosphate N-acetyltransferase GlmU n=1 Tax=Blastococcus sp. Marseille-P5729 TaxID=2086582 RepID=UPI000D0FE58C|nr:bifunctional UDP-N-acetylglucosamine diphosphorylase/glucosamine-1-phosphate N-acetyltransferase GlmU [Blastococcus sp. Marseille-P5729]